MIRRESVIISVFGALLGVALGLLLGVATVAALNRIGVTRLVVPGGQLLFLVVLTGLAGMLAAALPARRAARLDVLAAIGFE
jgi:putative ABC transport system permease protein